MEPKTRETKTWAAKRNFQEKQKAPRKGEGLFDVEYRVFNG